MRDLENQKQAIDTRRRNIIEEIKKDQSKPDKVEEPTLRQNFTELLDLTTHGLFTRRGHFIYELIQNAEDYEADKIEIHDTGECLVFKNDADPFDKEDVKNICGVGSHKLPEDGYIGYWGFGFKSVFQVTESPHIISWNEDTDEYYSFKFDRNRWDNDSDLPDPEDVPWQIAPFWVDQFPVDITENREEYNNVFILPYFNSESEEMRKIIDKQMDPKLLMFLQEIEEIVVKSRDGSYTMRGNTINEEAGGRIVELEPEPEEQHAYWWVYDSEYEVPKSVKNDRITRRRDRDKITERAIKIGIPLHKQDGELIPSSLESGSVHTGVFSFLPLSGVEETGLPFIIDADFVTEMGRSVPHPSAKWNGWLADEIGGQLIPEIVRQMKNKYTWKKQFYPSLIPPRPPDPERPIFRRIDRRLRGLHENTGEWIPDEKKEDLDQMQIIYTEGQQWVRRKNAAVPDDDEIRDLLPADDFEDYNAYPHQELNWEDNTQIEEWLFGERSVGIAELVEKIAEEDEWLETKQKEGPQWFRQLYSYLHREGHNTDYDLTDYEIIYTKQGLSKPADARLPVPDDDVHSILETIDGLGDRKLVPEEILPEESGSKNNNVVDFVEDKLDVHRPTSDDVVDHLSDNSDILIDKAGCESDAWFRKLYAVLSEADNSNILDKETIVCTGNNCEPPANVYFPSEKGDSRQLLEDIGKTTDVVSTVPSKVIDKEKSRGHDSKTFLSSLGISTLGVKEVVNEVVLPEITDENIAVPDLLQLTQYAKQELDPEEIEEGKISVVTKCGEVVPVSNTYLSQEYNPSYNMELVFSNKKYFISDKHINKNDKAKEWKRFFVSLGAHDGKSIKTLAEALQQFPKVNKNGVPDKILKKIYEILNEKEEISRSELSENMQLLTMSGEFRSMNELYIPDFESVQLLTDPEVELNSLFDNEIFVKYFSNEDGETIYPSKKLGLKSASDYLKITVKKGRVLEEPSSKEVENHINEHWDTINKFSSIPDVQPDLQWAETVQPQFLLDGKSRLGDKKDCIYSPNDNCLYCSQDIDIGSWKSIAEAIKTATDADIDKPTLTDILSEPVTDNPQQELEQWAVETVMAWERERKCQPKDVREDSNHSGYDVLSVRESNGEVIQRREIEIKALSTPNKIQLQESQWRLARDSSDFRLYVVIDPDGKRDGRIVEPSMLTAEKQEGQIDEEIMWKVPTDIWRSGKPIDFS